MQKRINSPGELLLGHVEIIRHTLKKSGVGSKVRRRRWMNGMKLVLIIAQIICVHIAIPTAIAVRIIAIIVTVLQSWKEHLTKQKVIGAEIRLIHDIISDIG